MLYGDLNRKEVQKPEDICICIADSFCCTVETNSQIFKTNFWRPKGKCGGGEG